MKTPKYIDFNVAGAGTIRMSHEAHSWTGGAIGFSFGVSWGAHKFAGGVLSRSEALKLANHIISECEKCTMSEEDELKMRYKDLLTP